MLASGANRTAAVDGAPIGAANAQGGTSQTRYTVDRSVQDASPFWCFVNLP